MDAIATVTSKGQVTIPKPIRDQCGIAEGDQIVFKTTDFGAVIIRVPDLADLAGAVQVPEDKRGAAWEEIVRHTRQSRAQSLSR